MNTINIKGRTYTVEVLDDTNGVGSNVIQLTGARGASYTLWPSPVNPNRYHNVSDRRYLPFTYVERSGDNWKVLV